jgi:zinc protease
MQLRFISFLLLFCVGLQQAEGQNATKKKILPFPVLQKKMSNGLNVVTVPFNSPGLAALFIIVRAGSRDEVEPGKTGFAHFFEHMMFRGTDKYPKEAYGKILQSIGAASNANTSFDRTVYHMTGNAKMLEKMFEIEGDRFQHLKYSEHDFKTEAGAVKGEYTKNSASPFSQLFERTLDTAFREHTYKHTTMGFFTDVVDMPNQYQYSITFFDRFYRPEYTTIVVVGDVKEAEVNKFAEKYFGTWKHGNYVPAMRSEPVQTATRYAHIQNTGFPPLVSLNYKTDAFNDNAKDYPALDVLLTLLTDQSGELYQRLVVKEQKARSIGGSPLYLRDPGLVRLQASVVKAEDMQYVKDEIVKALENAKTVPIDPKKFADTKSNIKYSFAMGLESPDQIANQLAAFIWLTGNPESLNNYYSVYDRVTPQDVMAVAKKYFNSNTLTIATIGPDSTGNVK